MPVTVTAKTWKNELKKQKVDKDAGFGDALDDYAKVAGKNLNKEADALEDATKKALAAGKLLKTNKELASISDTFVIQAKAELRRVKEAIKSAEEDEEAEAEGEDKALKIGLKRARSQDMYFALVFKGATEGTLLISKMKVKPAAVTEAKKELGGGRVMRGKVSYANGDHHFVTKQDPPATMAKLIKKLAKEHAGILIKPICRGGGDDEDESEE
jgi:hypothetical protein